MAPPNQQSHEDQKFLDGSPYCDVMHHTIHAMAHTLTHTAISQTDAARRVFLWVRDEITFRVGEWHHTASQTLAARSGTCSNKANLFVALVRACRIPAGFYLLHVRGQEYLGPIVPARLRKHIGHRSLHVYPGVCIDGQWIRCDPTDDRRFAETTVHVNPQSRLVEWDGVHDALLSLDPVHILDRHGPVEWIDDVLQKRPRIPAAIVRVGNLYVEFLRAHASAYHTQEDIERAFARWLRRFHPRSALVYWATTLWSRR
jgi:transglutaminase-like putative cysteine protease